MRSAYGLDTPRADEWREHANCHPAVAEKFWIHHGYHAANLSDDNRHALRLCRTCPVVAQCLADELAHPTPQPHIAAGQIWPQRRPTNA